MKKYVLSLMTMIFVVLVFSSCEKKDEDTIPTKPELPPKESMTIDFDKFKVESSTKSAMEMVVDTTVKNWTFALSNVVFWNIIVGTTVAVPVASFYASFSNEPKYLGDNKWEWQYDVKAFAATYKARMTGEVMESTVKWEMYVTKDGIGGFSEFKWFEGTSKKDGTGGKWILFKSHTFPEELMTIDWVRAADEVGEIIYTYVRELNDQKVKDPAKGSYLKYGLKTGDFDAYYDIYFYELVTKKMQTVNIEWNTTTYFGHVKAPHKFGDDSWRCWDNMGYDAVCK